MIDLLEAPPLLTADLPGVGGRIKQVPEDFQVEEIPAYQPSGQGEFLYLWIEKRDMGAEYFTRQMARRLGIGPGEVGSAGMKDRRAVTRQWVSVPARVEDRLHELGGEGIQVLQVSRHTNKLKPGHLRGNRFRVLIREPKSLELLGPIVERIRLHGLPNYYGAQRFGRDGETLELGLAMLGGESRARQRLPRSPFLRRLALSAVQSALFNRYLGQRLRDGLLQRVLPGDVMAKWPVGGLFVAEDLAREQARFEARETVHTGPMFGRKMFAAAGEAAAREEAVWHETGLQPAALAGFGKLLQGTRRHNLVWIADFSAAAGVDGVWLEFTLPAGSYATVLLAEVMKNDLALADDPAD